MVISGIQNDLDNLDLDKNNIIGTQNISKKILYDVFRKNIINDQNLYELIKGMFHSQLFNENKSQIKSLIKALLSDLVSSHKLLDATYNILIRVLGQNIPDFIKTPQASLIIKKILSKGTNLKLINTLKLNTIDLLTDSKTYAGIFDSSETSIINLIQNIFFKSLINMQIRLK